MKRTIFILALFCSIIFCLSACININPGKILSGNEILKVQDRGKMDFKAIDARGAFDVIISEISDAPVKVSGDENLIDFIETYVKDGVLTIKFKHENYSTYSTKIGIKITVPNNGQIKSFKSYGASNIIIEGTLVSDNLSITGSGSAKYYGNIKVEKCKIKCSGSTEFNMNIEAVMCQMNFSGSTTCNFSGSVDDCKMTVTGSSDIKGYDLIANKLSYTVYGSSGIQVTCNEELNIRTYGSSDVSYKGTATKINKHTAGSSNIIHVYN
jgi:Protein of unknown function (DUF2807).